MANVTTRLLWACMVSAVVIYVAVAYFVDISPPTSHVDTLMLPMFALAATGIAAATLVIRRRQLLLPIQSREIDLTTPQGMTQAFTPFILCLVLSEAIAIFGLVLAFLSGEPAYALAFSTASLVLLYIHRPTAPDLNPSPSAADRAHDPGAIT